MPRELLMLMADWLYTVSQKNRTPYFGQKTNNIHVKLGKLASI